MPSRRGSRRGRGGAECGCKSGLLQMRWCFASNWQPGSLEGPWSFRSYGDFKHRAYILHKCDHSFGNKQTSTTCQQLLHLGHYTKSRACQTRCHSITQRGCLGVLQIIVEWRGILSQFCPTRNAVFNAGSYKYCRPNSCRTTHKKYIIVHSPSSSWGSARPRSAV